MDKLENSIHRIAELSELDLIIRSKIALLIWFSHDDCSVCKALLPKVLKMRDVSFPKIDIVYCDTTKTPDIAAYYSIFTVPAMLLFFEGREHIREIRNFSIRQVEEQINRLYSLVFDE